MAEKLDKVWGTTECLLLLPSIQVHRIKFKRGGVCSLHYHKARYNAFYVISGRLDVLHVHGLGVDQRDMLQPGQLSVVPPEVLHRFEAVTDGEALEIYFPAEVQAGDIVRLTQGFMTR